MPHHDQNADARLQKRLARLDWDALSQQLESRGYARTGRLLATEECRSLRALFDRDERFRSTVEMEPRRYGKGRYRYFDHPLPDEVATLREALYPPLAGIANGWWARLGLDERFPPSLGRFLSRCKAGGQQKPTPLLLRYGPGGYNRLHQDVYGATAFPLQAAVLLSDPARDFSGGAFLLLEQQARMQARGSAIDLEYGEGILFPNALMPRPGPRGDVRAQVRHGVAEITRGERLTLGVIFHDAE